MLSRRQFFVRAGAVSVGVTAAVVLPGAMSRTRVHANSLPPVRDTINGILSFVVPGDDDYSRAQGMATSRPGGVHPGTTASLERTLDRAVPLPLLGPAFGITLPGAAAISALVNIFAATVNPGSIRGPFSAPFANLSHRDKARVFELLDTDRLLPGLPIKFAVNAIPTLAAFAAYSEVSAFDQSARRVTGRPVGWSLSRYEGTSEGWDEFRGYYKGVNTAG